MQIENTFNSLSLQQSTTPVASPAKFNPALSNLAPSGPPMPVPATGSLPNLQNVRHMGPGKRYINVIVACYSLLVCIIS